jgi:hypothetical protein
MVMRERETWLQTFGEFLLRTRLVKERAAPWRTHSSPQT